MRSLSVSLICIVLLLSVLLNGFFVYSRSQAGSPVIAPSAAMSSSLATMTVASAQAFGIVQLSAIPKHDNPCTDIAKGGKNTDACVALKTANQASAKLPASLGKDKAVTMTPLIFTYTISGALLPALPITLALYRDPGIALDLHTVFTLFDKLHVPLNTDKKPLIPDAIRFQTTDGQFFVLFSPASRTLQVDRIGKATSYTMQIPANSYPSDQALITIAKDFMAGFGIDSDLYGAPQVDHTMKKTGSGSKLSSQPVSVYWPLFIDSSEVIDANAKDVPVLSVTIEPATKLPIGFSMRLLSELDFVKSSYPTATGAALQAAAQAGGLNPVPAFTVGTKQALSYKDSRLVYLLSEDPSHSLATYLVPVLLLDVGLPASCPTCSAQTWRTFVPVLDSKNVHF